MPSAQPTVPIKRLSRFDRPAIGGHFLSLSGEDRRLRFGGGFSDSAIGAYVGAMDFARDTLFGAVDHELQIIGVAHLACSADHAELGISVLTGHRSRGIGAALLRRAHISARNQGAAALFMHCLAENSHMRSLAYKERMEVVVESGEADAWLKLPPPDAFTYLSAMFYEFIAHLDYGMKRQNAGIRRLGTSPG